ncbi:MAG: helix-turn-helix transcriptional regulator [Chloroflexota bacterium]
MTDKLIKKIRAKKLGVLLRDARKAAGKNLGECAAIIGVTSHRIGTFERGDASPSLPELESLAFFLDAPLSHFWGDSSLLSISQESQGESNLSEAILDRQQIIGAKLRQARQDAEMTIMALAKEIGLSSHMLGLFERGERAIPLPDLEAALSVLNASLHDYHDHSGVVGQWSKEQQSVQEFLELSPEIKSFVTQPVNAPFLEIAMRLSGMPVEEMRAVAEGLLDITY